MATSPYELQRLQRALVMKAKTIVTQIHDDAENSGLSGALVVLADITQLVQQWEDIDRSTKTLWAEIAQRRLTALVKLLKDASNESTTR